MFSRITLEMWRVFVTIAEEGSSVKAASVLHKSQSAISHSIKKMESELGKPLFKIEGRSSVLTTLGKILLPKAQRLLGDADGIEKLGKQYQLGFMDEVGIALDVLVPASVIHETIERFGVIYPNVSLRIYETSLSGTKQLLDEGTIALGISSTMPNDIIIEPFMDIPMICVCSPSFNLAEEEKVTQNDLKRFRQIVIRDSGKSNISSGWLGSSNRITVTHIHTALNMVDSGIGYAWLPHHLVQPYVESGRLTFIQLTKGATRSVNLQIGLRSELMQIEEIQTLFDLLKAVSISDDIVSNPIQLTG